MWRAALAWSSCWRRPLCARLLSREKGEGGGLGHPTGRPWSTGRGLGGAAAALCEPAAPPACTAQLPALEGSALGAGSAADRVRRPGRMCPWRRRGRLWAARRPAAGMGMLCPAGLLQRRRSRSRRPQMQVEVEAGEGACARKGGGGAQRIR